MMSLRNSTLSTMLLAAAATMAVGIAACSGSGGGDDDDDGNTPIPNPYDFCAVYWDLYTGGPTAAGDPTPVTGHRFVLVADTADWITGDITFDTSKGTALLYGVQFGAGGFTSNFAIASGGDATLTAPSNSIGEPLEVTVNSSTGWFVESTSGMAAQTISGGTGDIAASFFNEYEECFVEQDGTCPEGDGVIAITVASSSLSLGTLDSPTFPIGVSLSFCNDSAFAIGEEPSLKEALRRMPTAYPFK